MLTCHFSGRISLRSWKSQYLAYGFSCQICMGVYLVSLWQKLCLWPTRLLHWLLSELPLHSTLPLCDYHSYACTWHYSCHHCISCHSWNPTTDTRSVTASLFCMYFTLTRVIPIGTIAAMLPVYQMLRTLFETWKGLESGGRKGSSLMLNRFWQTTFCLNRRFLMLHWSQLSHL